jgi:hypothetical protein
LDKSAASFCHQVAAKFPDMFCGSYLLKNHNIANNSTAPKAREESSGFGIVKFLEIF